MKLKLKKVELRPSLMFRPEEFFIETTFKRVARSKVKIDQGESDWAFKQAIERGFIEYVKNAGLPPGIPVYRIVDGSGVILCDVE